MRDRSRAGNQVLTGNALYLDSRRKSCASYGPPQRRATKGNSKMTRLENAIELYALYKAAALAAIHAGDIKLAQRKLTIAAKAKAVIKGEQ